MVVNYRLVEFLVRRVFSVLFFFFVFPVQAQQFVADNQWVAPQGVSTIVSTVGQDYMQFYLVPALFQEWEFNFQLVHYYDDPRTNSGSYTSPNFFVKRRLYQNESETAGYAAFGGFGLFPQHLDQGEVTDRFQSWWAMGSATFAFANDHILWDLLPGATVNLNYKQTDRTAWGFTYSSRAAFYGVVPESAIVAEVFGTAGQASAPFSYRAGVRWEGTKWIIAATYSRAFNRSYGAGFELGVMYFTDALFGPNRKSKRAIQR